jgi:hypothetical protein
MMHGDRDYADLTITVREGTQLDAAERAHAIALFQQNYREANVAYLEKSFGALRHCAIAVGSDRRPAGFALGEMRIMDLPGLPQQAVALAGICCIAPEHRRRGLFGYLTSRAMAAAGIAPNARMLNCGRMAHPATFRVMRGAQGIVPKPGMVPTHWQQEVGSAIAAVYGAPAFDPLTFVVRGPGAPIGWPVINMDVAPEEWEVFRHVDRSRGDSLLGLGWRPDAPPGWDDID